jgi:hypothetical protein
MPSIINATTTTGVSVQGDNSGELALQTNNGTNAITIDTAQNVTFAKPISVGGNTLGAGNASSFKNRIINGAMVIDARNAGASVTPSVNGTYTLDRWNSYFTQASKFSVQQNAGSVTPPAGFTNYIGITSTAATTVGVSDEFEIVQAIEGFNTADLDFGKSTAKTITLSFWVRSSLTGTFGGSVYNNAVDWCFPFSYTISSANTWEQKSITIAGQTSGTWLTNNSIGMVVLFSLGAGSNRLAPANAWINANRVGPTGQVNLVATNGATLYITGVQLEVGSQATSFDFRDYGRELMLCQRYFVGNMGYQNGFAYSANTGVCSFNYPNKMRVTPTIGYLSGSTISVDFIGGSTNVTIAVTAGGAYTSVQGMAVETTGLTGRTTWQGLVFILTNLSLSAEL